MAVDHFTLHKRSYYAVLVTHVNLNHPLECFHTEILFQQFLTGYLLGGFSLSNTPDILICNLLSTIDQINTRLTRY